MSYIWTFAPENEALLQRCLSAAAPPDESNKWLHKFGPRPRNLNLINKTTEVITVNDSPEVNESPATQETQEEDISNAVEEFLDPDIDLLAKLETLVEKCKKTPKLLIKLAENLPIGSAEKLLEHVLNTEELNKEFLIVFHKYFLHSFIKRENSRFCTDILLKTFNKYPQYFKIALTVILKDMEIQNSVILDLILNLNDTSNTKLLEIVSDIELTSEEFSYNLFNIYRAYESCNKTESIQNYIFSCLKSYCDFCCSDKNYGKLLLIFLQNEKNLNRNVDYLVLEGLVERHKSPFKRACLSVLKELKEK